MLYLGSFNKNYFSVGNNPFFYQEGKSYPDDCNIKVPCFTVFNGYRELYFNDSPNTNLVYDSSLLYYAPFLNNYVITGKDFYGVGRTLYPILAAKKGSSSIAYDALSAFPYLYNINGKAITLPSLYFCEELNLHGNVITNCYYTPLHFDYNNFQDSYYFKNHYKYVPYYVFPEYDHSMIELITDFDKVTYVNAGGAYVKHMSFDFYSEIILKEINQYGISSNNTASFFWNFYGYVRSDDAIDLTPDNTLIEDKVAGKYDSIICQDGDITNKSFSSIYLGLSLYKMSFDDVTLYLYFLIDNKSFVYNTKTINRTDNSIEYYTDVGKDTKNKVSIGYLERYERGSDNVFRKVLEWAVINVEDTLQIGGYWKSDYIFSNNKYRIDEETAVTFTYIKNEDSDKTYSDIDLKYSGSTLDFSFLSKKPQCFGMELQRLGD